MEIISKETEKVTASFKVVPSIKEVIGRLMPAINYECEINNVDASVNQGDVLASIIKYILENTEPAYLISGKKYTYPQLITAEFDRNYASIKKEIPNAIKKCSKNYLNWINTHEYNNQIHNEPLFLNPNPIIHEILDKSIRLIYPAGLAYVQLIDQCCKTKFENDLNSEICKVFAQLVDQGYGEGENEELLLRIDNIDSWEI